MRVLVQGWIDYPHSYALVNVQHLLAFARRRDVSVQFQRLAPYRPGWTPIDLVAAGVITAEDQRVLDELTVADPGPADVILRISYPYDIRVADVPVVLFFTSEFKHLEDIHFVHGSLADFKARIQSGSIIPVTPSRWSAASLPGQCRVIPHGVAYSHTNRTLNRASLRRQLGIPVNAIVLLHVGAMTENKNVRGILKAFYCLALVRDDVYLVLKGLGNLYASRQSLRGTLDALTADHTILCWKRVKDRLLFIDETLSSQEMERLYHAADLYLSPYLAEGFNMPCLEALACGTPLVVSRGGPTDDFVDKSSARILPNVEYVDENGRAYLLTSDVSIVESILDAIADLDAVQRQCLERAPAVQAQYSWDTIVEEYTRCIRQIVQDQPINRCTTGSPPPSCTQDPPS